MARPHELAASQQRSPAAGADDLYTLSEWSWVAIAAGVALLVVAATVIMRRTAVASPSVSVGDGPRLVRDIRATMRKTGWTCIDVEPDRDSPAFSYTIGMGAKKLPDLLLVWDADRAARASLLNAVAEALTKRRGRVPNHFEPLGPGRVRLNRVYDNEFFEKCPLASVWNGMHGIKSGAGLQIVFPDENGYYPD